MMPYRRTRLFVIALICLLAGPVAAQQSRESGDHLRMTPDAERRDDLPTRGMPMDNVRDLFGDPRNVHGPVGDPPITRWDFDGFSVYFEHRLVLHSVDHASLPDIDEDGNDDSGDN